MNSIFNLDNPVLRFLGRVCDMIYLNLLCLVCCIPVITVGSSVAALYYCMLKISRDRDSSITSMFFSSFKNNLKQGMLMTVLFLGVTFFLLIDINACDVADIAFKRHIKIFLYVLLVLWFVIISYAFPILAQFENTIKNIIKNSLFLGFSNLGYSIYIVILNAIPFVLFFLLPEVFLLTIPIWLFFGVAIIAFINSKMFIKIFNRFL